MTTDTLLRDRTAVSEPDLPSVMAEMGRRAREAATTLSLVSAEAKVAALNNAAAAVRARAAEILAANARDLAEAESHGVSVALRDRLAAEVLAAPYVRHPSHGGAVLFAEGLRRRLAA